MQIGTSTRSGFTLIEVVVAVLLVSTVVVASLATYGAELRTLARARDVTVTVELAEDRLAAIELFALDRLPDLPDSLSRGVFPAPFSDFTWIADATSIPGQPMVEVRVEVTGRTGARHISTLLPIAPNGPAR